MSGLKKQKVYVYYGDGSKHSIYESQAAFSKAFDLPKNYLTSVTRPRFGENVAKIFETDLYASKEAIGLVRMRNYVRKSTSKFIKKYEVEGGEINCYNLDDELIATFKSKFHLHALLGNYVSVRDAKPKHPRGELYFVWKK